MMLGPFRIRGLRRAPPLPASLANATMARSSAAISPPESMVCAVDGSVYEDSIREIPEATLRYIDSDKDLVTVGSKHELADRLAEPLHPPRRSKRRSLSEEARPLLRPTSPDMHVFEIDPLAAAVEFWRSMEVLPRADQGQVPNEETIPPAVLPKRTKDPIPLYPSLEGRREAYFESSQPPQRPPPGKKVATLGSAENLGAVDDPFLPRQPQNLSPANVLTIEGARQAQLAGEQLRARLNPIVPSAQASRGPRANAINSWAIYSKTPDADLDHCRVETDQYRPISASAPTSAEAASAGPSSLFRPSAPVFGGKHPRVTEGEPLTASDPTPSSLHPTYYDSVRASLDKISPVPAEARNSNKPVFVQDKVPETAEQDTKPEAEGLEHGERDEDPSAEAVEITLAKMVFQTIGDMTKRLESMNEQFDAVLMPKLVAERLKSKNVLFPAHRHDTFQDIITLRRSIEAFSLEVAETKQTLARLDKANVFPENSNLIDFSSMTAAAYSFGLMIRSMDDMIITARRGMLAAQLADGEPKYHTPRRLARLGYEDVWAIHIKPVPSDFNVTKVHELVDDVRCEFHLGPLDLRTISFREGPERSVEIEIDGQASANETWNCLLKAPERSIRLSLSSRQITMNRKHYPDILRFNGTRKPEKKQQTLAPTPPPCQADIDAARLKALQDRRAVWRREFKARMQSVRFHEPPVLIPDWSAAKKDFDSAQPNLSTSSKRESSALEAVPQLKWDHPTKHLPALQDSKQPGSLKFPGSQSDLLQARYRPWHPLNKAKSNPEGMRNHYMKRKNDEPRVGPENDLRRLKYSPGPVPPPSSPPLPPPVGSGSVPRNRQAAFVHLPYDPARDISAQQLRKIGSKSQLLPPDLRCDETSPQVLPPLPPLKPLVPQRTYSTPPLPPLKPLVPQRTYTTPPLRKPESPPLASSVLPGSWPDTETQENESSGAFCRRMMGRSPAPSYSVSPISSPTLHATQPPLEIQRPVSPISLSTVPIRASTFNGQSEQRHPLRRSATTVHQGTAQQSRGEKSASGPWSRRPYSITFDGSGRVDAGHETARTLFPEPSLARPRTTALRPVSMAGPPTATPALARAPNAVTQPAVPAAAAQPEQSLKVQSCMDQLKQLGYGDIHNGGTGRLLMYAQLTEGDLEDTIDLIEEEREAWQERGLVVAHGEPAPTARDI